MSKKNIIHTIRNKEMDRRDFLKYSGLALASVVGLKSAVSLFMQADDRKAPVKSHKEATRGFGSGRYGA